MRRGYALPAPARVWCGRLGVMPELPDITVYVECLAPRVAGRKLERVRLRSPFLVRTVDPPLAEAEGRCVHGVERMGKRIVLAFEGGVYLVLHLMIAGRLRWGAYGAGLPGKAALAAFDFESGTLVVTEASARKRAALHVVRGADALRALDPGGLEPLAATEEEFRAALARENHTLKRALTSPHLLSGIGNAYSDEILHRARLSPLRRTEGLTAEETARLFAATRAVLLTWIERLRAEAGGGFPVKVTAFREGMAVHGRYREPCPDCGAPVQRIVHAENESNYCARCQTDGKIYADRALSRLLGDDWPRTLEEWEGMHDRR